MQREPPPSDLAAHLDAILKHGPYEVLRQKRAILRAFVETQLAVLWPNGPQDDADAIADGMLEYILHLPDRIQRALTMGVKLIDSYAIRLLERPLAELSIDERRRLLNQGELDQSKIPPAQRIPPLDAAEKPILHAAVAGVAAIARLVTLSRDPGRKLVRLQWPDECADPANLARVEPPLYPPVGSRERYDVCVIGSGAGGAVVAAKLAEQGKRVILVEEGDWVSPHELPQVASGRVAPPVDYKALIRLYRHANANVSVQSFTGPGGGALALQFLSSPRELGQTINFIQAKVVGGGPHVNNAIHLNMRERTWDSWRAKPTSISYKALHDRMEDVKRALGVSVRPSVRQAGDRAMAFVRGASALGMKPLPLPVAMKEQLCGHGWENFGSPFGDKIDGVHPYAEGKPSGYLMRALHHPKTPAVIAYNMRAAKFVLSATGNRVEHLVAHDLRPMETGDLPREVKIVADHYVVSAGPVASTNLLRASGIQLPGLGEGLSGNVAAPVYAVFAHSITDPSVPRPNPGIAQCYYVDEVLDSHIPALEVGFSLPGAQAVALTGWFEKYAEAARAYDRMVSTFMVTPSGPHGQVVGGRPSLAISPEEFAHLLAGMKRTAEIYLAAGSEGQVEIYLPTKAFVLDDNGRPLAIRSRATLERALDEIRRRGPSFLNMATSHPQGGNAMGTVVSVGHKDRFRVKGFDNLFVADASLFPSGCEINPQTVTKALAGFVAESIYES